jgi:hypothetical protein
MTQNSRKSPLRFESAVIGRLPPLQPYKRCSCGTCQECRTNAKWDRAFAKVEIREEDSWATKGLYRSTLRGW